MLYICYLYKITLQDTVRPMTVLLSSEVEHFYEKQNRVTPFKTDWSSEVYNVQLCSRTKNCLFSQMTIKT